LKGAAGRLGRVYGVGFMSDFCFLFCHLLWCWFFVSLVRSFRLFCGFGLVFLPCGDGVGCKEVWCFRPQLAVGSFFAHLSVWDCGVVFVVAVLQI